MKNFFHYKKLWLIIACFLWVSSLFAQETIINGEVKDEETPLAFATTGIDILLPWSQCDANYVAPQYFR